MRNALQTRALAIVLVIATLAVCILAGLNFQQENRFDQPTDGVFWTESQSESQTESQTQAEGTLTAQPVLRAERVPSDSPGNRAGLRAGDMLLAVNDRPTPRLSPFEREIYRSGIWSHATYTILRPVARANGSRRFAKLEVQVIVEPTDKSVNQGLRMIALVYLSIGLYVLFRRWTAPKSLHFFVFCLASFVLYAFTYTGVFNALDSTVFWARIAALALQPALFLHFAVDFSSFDEESDRSRMRRGVLAALIYLPGAMLAGLWVYAYQFWTATGQLLHRLDQLLHGYLGLYYAIAAAVFVFRYSRARSPLERQQLKWLTRGTLLAFAPYTLLNVVPLLFDLQVPSVLTKMSAAFLVVLPLTFSWAIVRYRLMDVDLIFKRGVTYTLATAALVGLYFAIVAVVAEVVHTHTPNLGVWGLLAAIIVTGLVFDPLKRGIQGRVDRVFDQKRFDYRETLVDFGRSLNSQTDLRTLTDSIVERLPQTLLVTRVAVFLAAEPGMTSSIQRFELAAAHGLTNLHAVDLRDLDLDFFDFDRRDANNHLFFENPQQVLRLPESQQQAARRLDLNYYLPCRVANREGPGARTVAVIGIGRTGDGDFLSSEDMELLESLAGYIGIAIQNAQLYRRLEQKAGEFERLTEFHENIVESINIGIFAVDLDDRINSWNSQMETLYARPRREAIGQPLSAVFPPEFLARFEAIRSLNEAGPGEADQGTHTLYKFPFSLPTGETLIANIAIAPLVTRTFKTVGRIVLVDDITDRIALETQLSQAEKLSSIGLLAAGVAHEVNTPLAVISSYTQMLAKQMRANADDPLARRLGPVVEKITQQTFRASEIVNGLLNFSRTSGAEFTSIDLNLLLRDTLVLLEHQFKTAQINVETVLSTPLPRIQGNQGKLQQVVLNLLLNAKDAMHGTSLATLRITTGRQSDRVLLQIRDTGSGIEREHIHRIFDPFFTTKVKPQPGQHKGTGLGLAVTYGIMQEHGGKIQVESEVGIGTLFTLDFPIAASSGVSVESHASESQEITV